MEIDFSPFPDLESARLNFRRITPGDVEEVFAMRSNPDVMKYIPRPIAKSQQDALDHIAVIDKGIEENKFINWGITWKGDNKLLGMICLINLQPHNFRAEVGYILSPSVHRQGIMNQALKTITDYAFNTMRFHSLEALIDPENIASARLLISNGFVKEAHFKERTFHNGVFLDDVIYSLLNPRPNRP